MKKSFLLSIIIVILTLSYSCNKKVNVPQSAGGEQKIYNFFKKIHPDWDGKVEIKNNIRDLFDMNKCVKQVTIGKTNKSIYSLYRWMLEQDKKMRRIERMNKNIIHRINKIKRSGKYVLLSGRVIKQIEIYNGISPCWLMQGKNKKFLLSYGNDNKKIRKEIEGMYLVVRLTIGRRFDNIKVGELDQLLEIFLNKNLPIIKIGKFKNKKAIYFMHKEMHKIKPDDWNVRVIVFKNNKQFVKTWAWMQKFMTKLKNGFGLVKRARKKLVNEFDYDYNDQRLKIGLQVNGGRGTTFIGILSQYSGMPLLEVIASKKGKRGKINFLYK